MSQYMGSYVTQFPLPGMTQTAISYITIYANYTMLKQPLEMEWFYNESGQGWYTNYYLQYAYQVMNPLGFFNNNYYNDYLNYSTGISYTYYWLKMIVLNQVIGGLFIPLTPRMVIEGYTDEFLMMMSMESLLDFGDMTLTSWISADNAAYAQKNNTQVGLNSGSNTYESTAQYVSIGS